jgi:hypothetical protein
MILNLWSPPKSPKVCLAIESSTSPWPTSWKSWVGLTIWNIACISTNHPYCMIAKHEKYLKPPTNATSYTLKDIVIMYIYICIEPLNKLKIWCVFAQLIVSLTLSLSLCLCVRAPGLQVRRIPMAHVVVPTPHQKISLVNQGEHDHRTCWPWLLSPTLKDVKIFNLKPCTQFHQGPWWRPSRGFFTSHHNRGLHRLPKTAGWSTNLETATAYK